MEESVLEEEEEVEKNVLIETIKKKKAEVNFDNQPIIMDDTNNNIFCVVNQGILSAINHITIFY